MKLRTVLPIFGLSNAYSGTGHLGIYKEAGDFNYRSSNSYLADYLSLGAYCSIFLMNYKKKAFLYPSRFSSEALREIKGISVAPF